MSQLLNTITSQCQLGEGPVASVCGNYALWVDIKAPFIYCLSIKDGQWQRHRIAEPLCWLIPSTAGDYIGAGHTQLYRVDSTSWQLEPLLSLLQPSYNRFNDAKVTPHGGIIFGTMDSRESQPSGALWHLSRERQLQLIDSGYTVSNGPAFSPDGRYLYTTDSGTRTIYRCRMNASGALADKRVFFRFSTQMGYPDGMCVDTQGALWVAAWQGEGVYRIGADAQVQEYIALPALQTTSTAFVGQQRNRLLVTSARVGLSEQVLAENPHNGNCFLLDVGHSGTPLPACEL